MGQEVVFFGQFGLKNTPDTLVESERLIQSCFTIRGIPILLAFFEHQGRLG